MKNSWLEDYWQNGREITPISAKLTHSCARVSVRSAAWDAESVPANAKDCATSPQCGCEVEIDLPARWTIASMIMTASEGIALFALFALVFWLLERL